MVPYFLPYQVQIPLAILGPHNLSLLLHFSVLFPNMPQHVPFYGLMNMTSLCLSSYSFSLGIDSFLLISSKKFYPSTSYEAIFDFFD